MKSEYGLQRVRGEVRGISVYYWGRHMGGVRVGIHAWGVASVCLHQEGMVRGMVRKEASKPAPAHLYTLLWKEL